MSKTKKILYGIGGYVVCVLIYFAFFNKKEVVTPATQNTVSAAPDNSATTNKIVSNTHTCDICRKEFSGAGYCEGDDGNFRPCTDADNTMPYLCSYECAMQKKQRINNAWEKVDKKVEEYNDNNSDDYYSREREKMRKQGYTQGEIDQMRDPNQGDPEIKESAKKVFDAIKKQQQQ